MMMRSQQLERNSCYGFCSFLFGFLVFVCMMAQFVYLLDMLLGWFVYLLVWLLVYSEGFFFVLYYLLSWGFMTA